MNIKEFREALNKGELDHIFTEVVMYYNLEDDRYYIYKKGRGEEHYYANRGEEHYYADAKDHHMALMLFDGVCEELKKAREEG